MRYYIEHLPMTIPMGVQSENNAEAVEFDVSEWLARDGSLSFSVWVTRPGETEAYQAANTQLTDGVLYWWPTSADTAIAGDGRVEILAVSANRRMLSGWTATSIRETTTETTTDAPVDQRPWLDQALLASEEAKAAATSAAASADQAEGVVKKEIATLTEEIALKFDGGMIVSDDWREANGVVSIRDLPPNAVYGIAGSSGITDKPPTSDSFALMVLSPKNQADTQYNAYIAVARTNIFVSRVSYGEKSITWIPMLSQSVGDEALSGISQKAVKDALVQFFGGANEGIFNTDTFSEKYGASLNDAPLNRLICGDFSGISDTPVSGFSGYVWSISNSANKNGCIQFAANYGGAKFYVRTAEGFNWTAWKHFNFYNQKRYLPDILAKPKIVLIGDSITHGYGASDFENGDSIGVFDGETKYRNKSEKCWGNRFANKMANDFGITCINNGISGWDFQQINQYFDTLVPSDTKIVICCAGTNNRGWNEGDFRPLVETFIDNCLSRGIEPIMLSPIDVNGASYEIAPAKMNAIIADASAVRQVNYHDLYNEFNFAIATSGKAKSDYYGDTLHPNDAGYELMFYTICKLLNY